MPDIQRTLIGVPRAGKREVKGLAPQISTLIVFDHLIGNRDRWSGHNVLMDMTHTRVIFLDHNLAFDAKLDVSSTMKRNMVLHRVQRFSRGLVARLREGAWGHRVERVVLVGFSAGGLSALLAAGTPGVAGYIGLDAFDRPSGAGREAARALVVPAILLHGPPAGITGAASAPPPRAPRRE